jgi:hypothetical protein
VLKREREEKGGIKMKVSAKKLRLDKSIYTTNKIFVG